jgi:hypothetical protein
VTARIDHAPALEDLSPAVNDADDCKPLTAEAKKGREENRGLHAPASENHSLAHASHTRVRWCPKGTRWAGACSVECGGGG